MISVGIDASNITSGGGLTHLVEILRAVDTKKHSISKIDIWAPQKTLDHIHPAEGIYLKSHPFLESTLVKRMYWQRTILTKYAADNYDILYVPGGSYIGSFRPYVTMNRNLLPFDRIERNRYGIGFQSVRMRLLEKLQAHTYRLADGLIFLSNEAKRTIEQKTGEKFSGAEVIPHGIAPKFFNKPREQKPIDSYSFKQPFRLLYVSTVTVYKHQWHVIKAVYDLRDQGYPVVLDLVGGITTQKGRELFDKTRQKYDPENAYIFYHGHKDHADLLNFYGAADGFIFASTCETFGQTLLESMASGLPVVCSDRSAMPEVLHDAGRYFDPEIPESIVRSLKKILDSADLRKKLASKAYQRAKTYSWKKCADKTFNFIYHVYNQHRNL